MKISPVVAGLTIAGLATAMTVTGTAGATAATFSEMSIHPIAPSTAAVCWTPYEPDAGSVTRYELTTEPGGLPGYLDPDVTPPDADGRYCATADNFKSGKKYTFGLNAQIDGGAYVLATPNLVALDTRPYSLTASYSRLTAKVGQKVKVSGVLKSSGKPVSNADIVVQQRLAPSDVWSQLGAKLKTNKNGQYARTFKVKQNTSVRTYFAGIDGGPDTVGSWNSSTRIDVSPAFTLSFSKNPVKLGKTVTARGEVTAAGDLDVLAGDNVCLQKKQGGSWGNGVCVRIGNDGGFQTRITPTSAKDLFYRWWAASVAPEYVAGGSPPKRLTVR